MLDRIDYKIIDELQNNARLSNNCLLYTSDAADEHRDV